MKIAQTPVQYSITFPSRGTLWILISLFALILGSCSGISPTAPPEFPKNPGYLVAGQNESNQFTNNALLIFDKTSLVENGKTNLPKSKIAVSEMDPKGNLWISLIGGINWDDNRVMVFSPSGKQIAEITTCLSPNAGIHFYAQKALIICRDTGFFTTITEVDINSYQVLQTATTRLDGERSFLTVTSALSGSDLVVAGLTNGPVENLTYTVLLVVDVNSLSKIKKQVELGEGTNVWAIIPYLDSAYILNSEGDRNPERKDVFVVDMKKFQVMSSFSMPNPSPLWGARQDNVLYTFHNGGWNSLFSPVERAMCETNLDTLKSTCHKLPDGFDGYDIGVLNNQPCITHWGDQQASGLYCLQGDGSLKLSIPFTDASLLIQPNQ
jgi:hypothetical protein